MTLKIDLKKAYDRIRWDFINASFQAASIPNYLWNVIMSFIPTSTIQLMWNGVPLSKFKTARGIRQVCPLSPYLFLLCMEWINQCFYFTIFVKKWSLILLSHSGSTISHLFFVDDLVIFNKMDLKYGKILKDLMENFFKYSGHKINVGKTNIFFTKWVDDYIVDLISSSFGF